MKAVLMSIHPKYCELIFNREKTIEVRRSCPKLETPFEVLVYATKRGRPLVCGTPYVGVEERLTQTYGYSFADAERLFEGVYNGKVIGSFVCDRIVDIKINSCNYYTYWHEWDDECDIEDMCLSYEELEIYLGKSVGYGWHITEPKLFDKPKELSEFMLGNGWIAGRFPVKRAPQSWMYVEEM